MHTDSSNSHWPTEHDDHTQTTPSTPNHSLLLRSTAHRIWSYWNFTEKFISVRMNCNDAVNTLIAIVACFRFFISPLLFLLGFVANVMVFYLFFTNKPLTRYNLYPMALSVFESIVLLLNAFIDDFLGRGLYYFSNGQFQIKVDTASLAACQFFEFAEGWSSFVVAYIMLAFGIDRVLSISLPHKFQRDRYIIGTLIVYAGIMLAGAALSAPIAADFELRRESRARKKLWYHNGSEGGSLCRRCKIRIVIHLNESIQL